MKLTPDQIEAFRVDAYSDVADEVCRLAVIGLERDERAERIGRAVLDACGTWQINPFEMFSDDTEQNILRAIAAAMREEQDHG